MKVIGRALDSIINDIQEAIDSIGRQQGRYKTLKKALDYIKSHDEWFIS